MYSTRGSQERINKQPTADGMDKGQRKEDKIKINHVISYIPYKLTMQPIKDE